jgi:hypothetical protein
MIDARNCCKGMIIKICYEEKEGELKRHKEKEKDTEH